MKLLGFSVEDWLALLSIISIAVGFLVWGFKKYFKSVYENASAKQEKAFADLAYSVEEFKIGQSQLNSTIKESKNSLENSNKTLLNHEHRITKIETKIEGGKMSNTQVMDIITQIIVAVGSIVCPLIFDYIATLVKKYIPKKLNYKRLNGLPRMRWLSRNRL